MNQCGSLAGQIEGIPAVASRDLTGPNVTEERQDGVRTDAHSFAAAFIHATIMTLGMSAKASQCRNRKRRRQCRVDIVSMRTSRQKASE